MKKSLYFSEPQSPGTNESFPEAPCGSLIQGNRVPFNSLGRVRAELEHFMGHSQMKHSAFVWSSVSQQERDQCIYRPDAPREEAKNSQQKRDPELTVAQIVISLLQISDLN